MNLGETVQDPAGSSFPRASRDESITGLLLLGRAEFPPRAGMNPTKRRTALVPESFPRACRDEPYDADQITNWRMFPLYIQG